MMTLIWRSIRLAPPLVLLSVLMWGILACEAETPTPAANWKESGHWHRDVVIERNMDNMYNRLYPNKATDERVATLDADPTSGKSDVALSLGCVGGAPIAYLTFYGRVLPPDMDRYTVSIADAHPVKFADSEHIYSNPILVSGRRGVLIINRAVLGEIVETLRKATGDLPEGEQLFAGVWRSSDGVGYQSFSIPADWMTRWPTWGAIRPRNGTDVDLCQHSKSHGTLVRGKRSTKMVKYPKARFSQGVIVPLEPLDLDEGAELSITILVKPNLSTIRERIKTLESSGGWSDSINGEELKRTSYESRGNSSELRGGEELSAGGEGV